MTVRRHNMINYEEARRQFRWNVPDRFNFVTSVIDHWAKETPDALAFWWVNEQGDSLQWSFAELSRRASRSANLLRALGVGPGDRVLVNLPRIPAWWEVALGCLKIGAVLIPTAAMLQSKDLLYCIRRAGPVAVVTDLAGTAKVDAVRTEAASVRHFLCASAAPQGWLSWQAAMAASSDRAEAANTTASHPSVCFFTSGTTGFPKMVLHTHASTGIGHSVTGRYWLDLRPGDILWNHADTGWSKGSYCGLFGGWATGATLFVYDLQGSFDPEKYLRTLERYPISSFYAPATVYRQFVLANLRQYRFDHVRITVAGGEATNPEVIDAWEAGTGHVVRDGYGQTETTLLIGNFPCVPLRKGSMGKASPGFEIEVVDAEGRVLPPGTEGEIAVRVRPERPVGLFQEYWDNPEETAAKFRGDWYYTGDRASKDQDDYFWFVGRADDVIISAGYRIGPFEVESTLLEHGAVADAAVVGVPDQIRGAVPKAFVVLKEGQEPSEALKKELQDFVKRNTAPYKYPRQVEFVQELPKTITGKIRRVELRTTN